MSLTFERLQHALGGRPFRFYEQIASTNDDALAWAQEGAPSGAVVVADVQTHGRGRRGRAWIAQPGTALMLSVVLRPRAEELPRMTMLGAVAVCDLLESLGLSEIDVKWPNDVRVRGRKISGVLPEAAWTQDRLIGVVLGIGLNVRVEFGDSPLSETATSVERALGRPADRLDLLVRLLESVDRWAALAGSATLYNAWLRRLSTLGQSVRVDDGGGAVEGVAERVDEQGALLIRTASGDLRRVVAGDLTFERES